MITKSTLEKFKQTIACLVPKNVTSDSMLLSCHEHTLCDCKVLEIISTLENAIDALKYYSFMENYIEQWIWNKDKTKQIFYTAAGNDGGKRARDFLASLEGK
jgi:hypothetical protein